MKLLPTPSPLLHETYIARAARKGRGDRPRPELIAAVTLTLLSAYGAVAEAQTVREQFYATNGPVNTAVLSGHTLYIAGGFTRVGPAAGGGVPFHAKSANAIRGFPRVTGIVHAVVPDGDGGWYIGGSFSRVGDSSRNNIAHILPDNSVAAWNPNADREVDALAVSGTTVYVGGHFFNIGGQRRLTLAALDATTGLATDWHPRIGSSGFAYVNHIVVSGTNVYVGGAFRYRVFSQERNSIAAFDAATGSATVFNPSPQRAGGTIVQITGLALTGTTLYVAGEFIEIGGQPRNKIAALDATTGVAIAWNPTVGAGPISALTVSGSTVYAMGLDALSAVDANTGAVTVVNRNFGTGIPGILAVATLAVGGNTLYAGGPFGFAALDAVTLAPTGWDPKLDGNVRAIAVSEERGERGWHEHHRQRSRGGDFGRCDAHGHESGTVYLGGASFILGGRVRNQFAALDANTGIPTAWDPNTDAIGGNCTLAVSGTTVYAAGPFRHIGGQARNGIAALDATTGRAHDWNPDSDIPSYGCPSPVTLAVSGQTIYVGGSFTRIGGQARNGLAALDVTTGLATAWDPASNAPGPTLDCSRYALAVTDNTVYVSGLFDHIGGQPRRFLAALDRTTALATPWDPNPNYSSPLALAVSGNTVYVGGYFSQIGGSPRNGIAALDATTGLATPWDPSASGPYGPASISAMILDGDQVYVGGSFDHVGGQARGGLAALDASTGLATPWNPNPGPPGPYFSTLAVGPRAVYVGGGFFSLGGLPQSFIAAIEDTHERRDSRDARANTSQAETLTSGVAALNSPHEASLAVWDRGRESAISYALPKDAPTRLAVFDVLGRRIASLEGIPHSAGTHRVNWDSSGLAGGIYFLRLETADVRITKRIVHLK